MIVNFDDFRLSPIDKVFQTINDIDEDVERLVELGPDDPDILKLVQGWEKDRKEAIRQLKRIANGAK